MVTGPAPLPPCSLKPTSVTLGPNSVNSTLSVDTSTLTAGIVTTPTNSRAHGFYAAVLPLWLIGAVLATRNQKQRRRKWLMCTFILFVAILPVACGSGGSQQPVQFTPKTFQVTVQAKDNTGAINHSTMITLTVQ